MKTLFKNHRIFAVAPAFAWAVFIFCLSAIEGTGLPPHQDIFNVVAHFCEYAIFAVLLSLAFGDAKRALWKTAIAAVVVASVYGISDEVHQLFVFGRTSDPLDWLTDTLGALFGVACVVGAFSRAGRSRIHDPFYSEKNQARVANSIDAAENGNVTVRELEED